MLPVKCNQHPWMKMYVNVVKSPFFAVTDKDGKYEIKGLPPGDYTLAFVQEKLGEQDQKVTLGHQRQQDRRRKASNSSCVGERKRPEVLVAGRSAISLQGAASEGCRHTLQPRASQLRRVHRLRNFSADHCRRARHQQ